MTEVAPDVREGEPGELTDRTRGDHLNIGVNRCSERLSPIVTGKFTSQAQLFREFAPVAHKRENRMPLATYQPSTFHFPDELSYRGLAKLSVALEDMCCPASLLIVEHTGVA